MNFPLQGVFVIIIETIIYIMVKRKTKKRKVGRPRKGTKKKQKGGAVFGLAASVLTPMAVDVIGTSITKKKPITKVMQEIILNRINFMDKLFMKLI